MPPEQPQIAPADWKVSLALLACIMSACATLNVVMQDLGWWFIALLAAGIVLGAAGLVRLWAPWRAVPPLVAAIALFGFLTQQFAPETTFIGLFPTFDTFGKFGELIALAQKSIEEQTVPAEVDPGILFLVAGGIGLIALAADILAIALKQRAWVGVLVLVVLWIPVLTVERDFDVFWVIATSVSYLYLLRADAPVPDRRLTLAVGAGALAVALVGQVVLPTTEPVQAVTQGSAIRTGDSPIVNLGSNLRRDVERRALTYSNDSGSGEYLRLVSLDQFDGDKWFVSDLPPEPENLPDEFGTPPGLSPEVERETETTRVLVANLDTAWLPLPYPTRSVTGLGRGWTWDAESLSLRNPFGSSRNQEYVAESLVLNPTPEQLLEAGSTVPRSVADLATIQQEEEVPPIIEETARAVVGDAESIYEKALALQQYLRAGDFVYSEDAPVEEGYDGTGLGVISTFLVVKSGYCVHFASAMALMARSLGIPARVAVGFLPGERLDQRLEGRAVYEATSHDLHAWPELYFDGIGWMPFEPTATRGVVPDYADTSVAGVPVPVPGTGVPEPAPTDPTADDPLARDAGDNSGSGPGSGTIPTGILWLIGLSLLGLLLVSTPALIRVVERRRRISTIRRGFAPAALGWHEVLQSAEDVGLAIPGSATPRESGRLLAEAIASGRRPDKDPDGVISAATSALARIVTMIELEGYARPGHAGSVSADDVEATVGRLRSAQDWWGRVRAVLLPASLWRRAVRALRSRDAG